MSGSSPAPAIGPGTTVLAVADVMDGVWSPSDREIGVIVTGSIGGVKTGSSAVADVMDGVWSPSDGEIGVIVTGSIGGVKTGSSAGATSPGGGGTAVAGYGSPTMLIGRPNAMQSAMVSEWRPDAKAVELNPAARDASSPAETTIRSKPRRKGILFMFLFPRLISRTNHNNCNSWH
jgi:hypothetical protein